MAMTKEQATKLAIDHVTQEIIERVKKHFENAEPFDTLPAGTTYLPPGWQESDYWLLPYPELGTDDSLHTGGESHYISISKINGEVYTITIHGE